jgi:hypothetical protein
MNHVHSKRHFVCHFYHNLSGQELEVNRDGLGIANFFVGLAIPNQLIFFVESM